MRSASEILFPIRAYVQDVALDARHEIAITRLMKGVRDSEFLRKWFTVKHVLFYFFVLLKDC
jgi:hypothetical protein